MKIIRSSALRTNLQETIDEVHYTGKPVIVTRHGKPWVMLTHLADDDKTLQAFIKSHVDPKTGKIRKS